MGVGQFLLLVGASIVMIGPKDLPIVARNLGYGLGRAMGALRGARNALREAAKDPEIERMSQDLTKGLEVSLRGRADACHAADFFVVGYSSHSHRDRVAVGNAGCALCFDKSH